MILLISVIRLNNKSEEDDVSLCKRSAFLNKYAKLYNSASSSLILISNMCLLAHLLDAITSAIVSLICWSIKDFPSALNVRIISKFRL